MHSSAFWLRRSTILHVLVDEEEYDPDLHDDQSEDLPSANEGDFWCG